MWDSPQESRKRGNRHLTQDLQSWFASVLFKLETVDIPMRFLRSSYLCKLATLRALPLLQIHLSFLEFCSVVIMATNLGGG